MVGNKTKTTIQSYRSRSRRMRNSAQPKHCAGPVKSSSLLFFVGFALSFRIIVKPACCSLLYLIFRRRHHHYYFPVARPVCASLCTECVVVGIMNEPHRAQKPFMKGNTGPRPFCPATNQRPTPTMTMVNDDDPLTWTLRKQPVPLFALQHPPPVNELPRQVFWCAL